MSYAQAFRSSQLAVVVVSAWAGVNRVQLGYSRRAGSVLLVKIPGVSPVCIYCVVCTSIQYAACQNLDMWTVRHPPIPRKRSQATQYHQSTPMVCCPAQGAERSGKSGASIHQPQKPSQIETTPGINDGPQGFDE